MLIIRVFKKQKTNISTQIRLSFMLLFFYPISLFNDLLVRGFRKKKYLHSRNTQYYLGPTGKLKYCLIVTPFPE